MGRVRRSRAVRTGTLHDHRRRAQHGQIDLCRRPGAEPRPAPQLEGRHLLTRDVPTRTAHRPTGNHHRGEAVPQGEGHHRAGRGLSADRYPKAHGGAHRGLAAGEHLLRDRGEGAHHPQAAPPRRTAATALWHPTAAARPLQLN